MQNKQLITFLRYAAITGNILFMLWVTMNALKERFSGTIYEKISYVGLMGLLILNSFLITKKSAFNESPDQKI